MERQKSDLAYQKAILGSVSRTFALTIPLLPPAMEVVVGNTYLLCRIVDTIEDAGELLPNTKQELSSLFLEAVLGSIPVNSFVEPCLDALKAHSNTDELDLISHTPTVLRILHTFSNEDQAAISRCVSIMSEGMSYFHNRQSVAGLKDLGEFEKYCYVVAGVVGELLTTIFSNYSPEFARGVSWIPANMTQTSLLSIAYQKLQNSLAYIFLIPKTEKGMRQFCFLAFGLAVMTLEKIASRKELDDQAPVKLSRNTVWWFYGFTKIAACNDLMLTMFFRIASQKLRKNTVLHS
ncbi:MAG: squalene/phytoene synthase [Polynucleobacter sp. 24-46-87]|nr:MAG: squalene/phytoene synthase [Polynucleobacter sp. 24-46-87]